MCMKTKFPKNYLNLGKVAPKTKQEQDTYLESPDI